MCGNKTLELKALLQPFVTVLFIFSLLISGCSESEHEEEIPVICPLDHNIITISDIKNVPENVTFNKVVAEITGTCWSIIDIVESPSVDGQVTITLPTTFLPEELQDVESRQDNVCGHWRATSSNPEAHVATLGDIIAYSGDKKVGRIYLSNWIGQGSSAGKAFLYYQYADCAFKLSGRNTSYYYSDCSFNAGWNVYANINPSQEETVGNVRCTTSIPEDADLSWCFESWVH